MFVVWQFRVSGGGEQSFENEEPPARRTAGEATDRSEGALLRSATAGDTTGRESYGEHDSVRYQRPKEREENATRATAEGG